MFSFYPLELQTHIHLKVAQDDTAPLWLVRRKFIIISFDKSAGAHCSVTFLLKNRSVASTEDYNSLSSLDSLIS